ncbi:MAG: hypothetical protein QUS12_09760 [Methanosarcina sp.]|nr:hypothetical protein [Methanosarcina sp.]
MALDPIFRPGLTAAVKEVSKEFSHLPGYEQQVQEHVDKLELFFEAMSKPVKPK